MEVKTFGVIGAGQMGNGIAQVAAASGLAVIMNDIKQEFVDRGLANIAKNLQRNVDKGKLAAAEKDAILGRIKTSIDLKDMAAADFVVEAASENESIKFKIFEDLEEICAPHVILASNTSSIPIGRIASHTKRPDKVIGMHFMNPVPVMKLVEVIRASQTSDAVHEATVALARQLGKEPVSVNDSPGFVSNRILMPMIRITIIRMRVMNEESAKMLFVSRSIPIERKKIAAKTSRNGMMWLSASML
jgi:3-hydroxybutyryl-CoA dehydrogenase